MIVQPEIGVHLYQMENPVLGNFSSPLTGVDWNILPHEEFSYDISSVLGMVIDNYDPEDFAAEVKTESENGLRKDDPFILCSGVDRCEKPEKIIKGHSKMMSDHLMVSEGHMDHHNSFLALKTQGMDEVVLSTSVRDLYFSDTISVPNELIVEQSVEVGVDDEDPRIILVPNNQIIKQEGEVVICSGDVESEEVIIGGPMDSSLVDHFAIGSSIDIGSDDAAGFEDDTKLIIDTEDHYGLGDHQPEEEEEEEEEEMSAPCITFNCGECGLLFKSRGTLRRHVHSVHKQRTSKKSASREKVSPMGPQRYVCTTCPYTSQRRDKLDRHMEKHVMKDGMHPCGKKRHKPSEMPQRHRHNAEEYHCAICPYTCTVYRAMKKHGKMHTSNTIQYNVKVSCKVCGKDRPSEAKMTKHMAKHRKGEHFLCDLCSFSSVQLKKIIQHRRMHTGEKPHLCPHCDYRSARRDNLRSHVRRMHKRPNMYIDTFNPNGEESDLVVN